MDDTAKDLSDKSVPEGDKEVKRTLDEMTLDDLVDDPSRPDEQRAVILRLRGNKILVGMENAETALPEALECFTRSIQFAPHAESFCNRSLVNLYLSRFDDALVDAEEAIRLKPDWYRGHYRKGKALHYLKKWDESLDVWTAALERWPDVSELKQGKELMQRARMAESGIREIRPQALFTHDHFLKLKNNPKTAPFLEDPAFIRKLQIYQENPSMIQIKDFQNDQRIMSALNVLMGLEDDYVDPMDPNAARLIRKKQREHERMARGMEIEYRKQERMKRRLEKGEVNEKGEDSDDSSSSIDESGLIVRDEWTDSEGEKEVKAEPAPPAAEEIESIQEKTIGNEHYARKEFDEALAHYDRAIELDPTNAIFLLNKSAVYTTQKRFEDGLRLCDEAIALAKRGTALDCSKQGVVGKAFLRIGNIRMAQGRFEDAETAFQESVWQDKTPEAMRRLAHAKKKKGEQLANENKRDIAEGDKYYRAMKYGRAIEFYGRAISRTPKDHLLYSKRSAAHLKIREFKQALKDCQTCLDIEPTFLTGLLRRADIFYAQERYRAALKAYERVLDLYPSDSDAARGVQLSRSMIDRADRSFQKDAEEEMRRKMEDPEIRSIMMDSGLMSVIHQMQEDPRAAAEFGANPVVQAKLKKLVEAGILKVHDPTMDGKMGGYPGMPIMHPGYWSARK